MRVGLVLPVVADADRAAGSEWERTGDLDDISLVAEAADRFGYHHLAWPACTGSRTGWDPMVTLAYLAARTEQILLVAPAVSHPMTDGDRTRFRTLQRTARGRLVLEVSRECASGALGGTPTWLVGETDASARHALAGADGWRASGPPPESVVRTFRGALWPPGFQVVVGCGWLDPIGEPEAALQAVRSTWAVGASLSTVRLSAVSADHLCEQMTALRDLLSEDGEV